MSVAQSAPMVRQTSSSDTLATAKSAMQRAVAVEVALACEARPVPELRRTAAATRKAVDAKRAELRALVAARYRDLIASADEIVAMRDASSALETHVAAALDAAAALRRARLASTQPLAAARNEPADVRRAQADADAEQRRLRAAARRAKALLGAPARVWSALARHDTLGAAQLVRRFEARRVPPTLAAAPLFVRHARVLASLPAKVRAEAHAQLHARAPAPDRAASAMRALKILGDSTEAALDALLEGRVGALRHILARFGGQQGGALRSAAESVRGALLLVDQLCGIRSDDIGESKASEERGLFDDATWSDDAEDDEEEEENHAIDLSLTLEFDSQVRPRCKSFISRCEELFKENASKHLQNVDSLQNLASVWRDVSESVVPSVEWRDVCERVLGEQLDVWRLLLAAPLALRTRAIVEQQIDAIPLGAMLANAVRAVDDADRDVGAHLWHTPLDAARRNDVGGLLAALAEPSGDALWLRGPAAAAVPVPLDEPEPSDGDGESAVGAREQQLAATPHARAAALCVERALARLLSDARTLASAEAKRALRHSRKSGAEAEEALWQTVYAAASDALQRLCIAPDGPVTTQLRSTSSASKANESSTEVLLLGRVCSALATRSTSLKAILGGDSPACESLCNGLRVRTLAAHWHWLAQTTNELGGVRLSAALKQDSGSLVGARRRATWMPLGGDGELMPSQISSPIFAMLLAASGAVQRAGAHRVEEFIVRRVARQLACVALDSLAAEDIVDKELVVQRLLDVRFVSDVLLGGSFSDDFGPTAAAAAELLGEPNNDEAQRKWRTTKEKPLLRALEAKLDPIDLAFYEPLIATMARRCYRRSAALFGVFTQLAPVYSDDKSPLTSASDVHAALALAPPLARFARVPLTSAEADADDESADESDDEPAEPGAAADDAGARRAAMATSLEQIYREFASEAASARSASEGGAAAGLARAKDAAARVHSTGAFLKSWLQR